MPRRVVHHGAVSGDDPKLLVRRGYDALSYHYRADDADDGNYGPWLAAWCARIPAGAAVLDLGCGNGIPVARHLAAAGYRVTGVDFSQVQIQRARRLVPAAAFLHRDITTLILPAAAFDAVVCLYTLIHLPLAEQPPLLGRIAGWLRPGAGCWRQPATRPGPVPRRAGSVARCPCGGATPTCSGPAGPNPTRTRPSPRLVPSGLVTAG